MKTSSSGIGRTFTIEELCRLTDSSRRTVRYYIQRGLCPRPTGETRSAVYDERHVEAILRVKRLSAQGVRLEDISTTEQDVGIDGADPEVGSIRVMRHIALAPGLELVVDSRAGGLSRDALRLFALNVRREFERLVKANPGRSDGKASDVENE